MSATLILIYPPLEYAADGGRENLLGYLAARAVESSCC